MKKWAAALMLPSLFLTACSRRAVEAGTGHSPVPRMLVFGIDGMDPDFLEAHWNSLPHLNRLRQEGDFRRLGTTIPPQSPVAWSTVATGLDPGEHGIFDFIHRDTATHLPISSMAEAVPPSHSLSIGPYLIPITSGRIESLRSGRTFWQLLANRGIPAAVIRIPANFPPAESDSESLSGMGTPDLTGSFGTFTFFTDDPNERRSQVSGGRIVHVSLKRGLAQLNIEGPPNTLRRDHAVTHFDLTMHVDPREPSALFEMPGARFVLAQGEWSDWLHADFHLIPGVKSVSGIFRIYVQQLHPHLRIYVSPVNIDPEDPALPISRPADLSRDLVRQLGPYYTQGIAEETSALRAGILSRPEFLVQSHKVFADNLRMFHYELRRFSDGLLFYYFSSIDQNSHMLWGKYNDDLLDFYRQIDEVIGEAMRLPNTTLLVLSDHGFAPFRRAVHLNRWLMREGYLALDSPANTSDEAGLPHVVWDRTQAYALGLNGIYLNLNGRERHGVVSLADKRDILEEIAGKLKALRDPVTGEPVIDKVYFSDTAYHGSKRQYAPDIVVGYRRGYRASWQTALGAVPASIVEDNNDAWIGDHCMAADSVPGVLLSNRKFRLRDPQMDDIAPTILSGYGLPAGTAMRGRTVF